MRRRFKYILILFCLIGIVSSYAQTDNFRSRRHAAEKIAKENNLKGDEYNSFIESYVSLTKEQDSQSPSDNQNKVSAACGTSSGVNIGFELNNYSDWYFSGGTNLRSLPDSMSYSLTAGTKSIVTGGIDAISSVSLTSPLGGLRVIKLNDNIANIQTTSMKTKFKVTPSTSMLKTASSLVLQYAAHYCKENPYFKIQILNCDESVVYHEYYSLNTDGLCSGVNPFAFTGQFTPWNVLCFDLSPYIGQAVVLKVSVGDCLFTGHYGYCYFDAALSPSSGSFFSNTININSVPYPFNSNFSSTCFSAPLTVSAPSGAASYTWAIPSSTVIGQTFTTGTTGYYSVAMTNTGACRYEKHYEINITPTISLSSSTSAACAYSNYTLIASGANTYSWLPISSSNPTIITSSTVSPTYTLFGYSLNKTCVSPPLIIPITIYPLPSVSVTTSPSACIGSSISASANGALTYTWSTGSLSNTTVISPTTTTSYYVSGKDAQGCISPFSYFTVTAIPTNTNVYAGSTTTSICVGDSVLLVATTWQSSYLWSSGATTYSTYVKPTTTAIYSVDIGSTCGPVTRTVQITVNSPLGGSLVVTSPATVCPNTTFSVVSSGFSSYSYNFNGAISNSNPANANLSSTVTAFTVTAIDAGGCKTYSTVPISVAPTSTLTVTGPTVICVGQTLTLTVSGANTYTWMNSSFVQVGTGNTFTTSPAANTNLWIIGQASNGCNVPMLMFPIRVDNPSLNITSTATSVCIGGTVNLFSSNYNAVTSYTWDNGANTSSITITPTTTSTYSLTVNNSACGILTATKTISFIPFNNPTVTITAPTSTACVNTTIKLTANGANSYVWFNSVAVPTLNVTSSTANTYSYWVIGTDVNGCKGTSPNFTVTYYSTPTVGISGSGLICAGSTSVISASGANTYSWSTGSTANSITVTPSTTTTYSVIGYNTSGCFSTASKIFYIQALPTLTITSNANPICPGNMSTLNVFDASNYVFSWSTGSLYDTTNVAPSTTTSYTCTTYGPNNCTYSRVITVTVSALPTVSLGVSSNTFCAFSGVPLILSPSPAGGGYSPPGITSNTLTLSSPGTYSITYQYNIPCPNKTTQIITVLPLQCALLSVAPDTMCVGQSSLLTYTPSGGTLSGPFISGSVFTPTASGTYSVNYNYVDAYGCNYSDCESLLVNVCTTIKEFGLESVSVYPNPFTNEFTINNPTNLELNITVYDLNGKLIRKYTSDKTNKLNAENYSDGIYYLHISSKEFSKFVKLIKL